MLDNYFKLTENKTNYKTEIIAGITSFLSMAYILGVNPTMLSNAGMPASGVFFSTAIAGGIACIVMGLISNYPVELAPVMGLNAFFTYTIIIDLGNTWETALAAVFLSSIIFLFISISRLRDEIINAIPNDLKLGFSAGIGFFLAFLGLKSANIIVDNTTMLVSMGNLFLPSTFLALNGIFIVSILHVHNVRGDIFFAIILTAILGLIMTLMGFGANDSLMPSIPSTVLSSNIDFSLFGGFLRGFKGLFSNIENIIMILFSQVFVLFFDATGTLLSLAKLCGFNDENGEPIGIKKAYVGNALGVMIGSICGTSTVSSYVESATGIEAGGRTGITAIVTGICFLISILFSPLILSLFTTPVTSCALIFVGILMVKQLDGVNWSNPIIAVSVFIMIIMTMLTNSISLGIAWGFSLYFVLEIISGDIKELNLKKLLLAIVFIIYLFMGL